MAEKHLHTVNLRKAKAVTSKKRTPRAMRMLREYAAKHSDADEVSISHALNRRVWTNGTRNPPRSLDIQIVEEDGTAYVELADREVELPSEEPEPAAAPADLSDEDVAELNVDEVKDLVRDGAVEAQRALDIEFAGKNRKSLIDWLEGRLDGADEDDEPAEQTYDLPADVLDVFRDGTIGEGKDAAKELGKSEFEKLLNFEEAHQNRKGMKQFLMGNMN